MPAYKLNVTFSDTVVEVGMIVDVRYQAGGSLYNYITGRVTSIRSNSLVIDASEKHNSNIMELSYDNILDICATLL